MRSLVLGVVALGLAVSCASGEATGPATSAPLSVTAAPEVTAPPPTPSPTESTVLGPTAPPTATETSTEPATECTAEDSTCLLPWPSNAYTVDDPTTATGRRLSIAHAPVNADGVTMDVGAQNRADGFSPGSAVILHVPGVDVEASGLPGSTDIGR